jgi:hypothetical protein
MTHFQPFDPLKYLFSSSITKISDRLMGQLTYYIVDPSSAQPEDLADSKFFWAENTQHQITKYSAFLDF